MNLRFSALLLAGGKSSRMGTDKAELLCEGVPLWQRQLRLLAALEPESIFVAGPRHADADASVRFIEDAKPNCGPLAAIVAGLRICETPLLLALAVDLPRMNADYPRALLTHCELHAGVVPVTDRFEPLAAIYPSDALAIAEEQLANGALSLHDFVRRCLEAGLLREEPASPALFHNLNTPADWQGLQQ